MGIQVAPPPPKENGHKFTSTPLSPVVYFHGSAISPHKGATLLGGEHGKLVTSCTCLGGMIFTPGDKIFNQWVPKTNGWSLTLKKLNGLYVHPAKLTWNKKNHLVSKGKSSEAIH